MGANARKRDASVGCGVRLWSAVPDEHVERGSDEIVADLGDFHQQLMLGILINQ